MLLHYLEQDCNLFLFQDNREYRFLFLYQINTMQIKKMLQELYMQNLVAAKEYMKQILNSTPDCGTNLVQAMRYAIGDYGKLSRSSLLMLVANLYGTETKFTLPAVAALELIHNYSLVHDDLPALDNDDIRRGKASCHRQFGEATAILAGDGLLTMAFNEIIKLRDFGFKTNQILDCLDILSYNAGHCGMILGQALDLKYNQNHSNISVTCDEITRIHILKTGMLFSAAIQIGSVLGNKNEDPEYQKTLRELSGQFGAEIGKLFQIYDDIDDIDKDYGLNLAAILEKERIQDLTSDTKIKIYQYAAKLFDYVGMGDSGFKAPHSDDFIITVAKSQQIVDFIFEFLGMN